MKMKVTTMLAVMPESDGFFNAKDLERAGIMPNTRLRISYNGRSSQFMAVSFDDLVPEGTVLMTDSLARTIGAKDGDEIDVVTAEYPVAMEYVRRKIDGCKLTDEEIREIVLEINSSELLAVGIAAFSMALQIRGMDKDEMAGFARALAESGSQLHFDRPAVFDFHSMGGVPGNKVTPIVVSIVAAAGLYIPKTSSRAISSACGTADYVETFCDIRMDEWRMKEIVERVGGAFAWGGSMNLARADDLMINVESQLRINPHPKMIASILSKKLAAGATHLLMDLPTGGNAKVRTMADARRYAMDFMEIGEMIGLKVECAITSAEQPIGFAVGPNLEARECIAILEGDRTPIDTVDKACELAGMMLEMAGVARDGAAEARRILDSGEAHRKFMEIAVAQGAKPSLKSSDLRAGKYSFDVTSSVSGYVPDINNKKVVALARTLGSPQDKAAGLVLRKKVGSKVEAGDVLFTMYTDHRDRMESARALAVSENPVKVEGAVIGKMDIRKVGA